MTHKTALNILRPTKRKFLSITAIAKNEVFKHLKNQKKDIRTLGEIRKNENEKSKEIKYDQYEYQNYIEQVKTGCLFAILKCLPFNQRCAFILHILNEISINTVSNILNKSKNATRILVSRAKSAVKEFLCDNCEHISNNPHCRCRNMINFSIKNNLIKEIRKDTQVERAKIELQKFKDEIEFFKSITDIELIKLNLDDAKYKIIFKKK